MIRRGLPTKFNCCQHIVTGPTLPAGGGLPRPEPIIVLLAVSTFLPMR